jgi:salicylate biosynthesis isochorismate synthase
VPAAGPIFSGFSFHADGPRDPEWAGFSGADAVVPAISLSSGGTINRLVVTPSPGVPAAELIDLLAGLEMRPAAAPFDPGDHALASHPSPAQWRTEVEEAIGAIAQGDISKVVLSRRLEVTTEIAASAFDLVDHLRAAYPQCHVFVWQVGDAAFVGATPELLLAKANGSVRVNPLAGTARRGEGEADDRAVGEALMHSAKDRHEHALVVDDIAARLEPLVESLHIPQQPSLRRIATVQHLSTEIVGTVDAGMHPLQLVDALHPTPAVGGTPRSAALAFLDKIEGIDRGWYTGGIGWLTSDGTATFAIPLRCALIDGRTSYLYAGAGIVAESRPEAELEETRLKFRPMLNLLTAS